MTIKTISGTYTAGYTLTSSFSAVTVTSKGVVAGANGTMTSFNGTDGQIGLTLPNKVSLANAGFLGGGDGGTGAVNDYNGGAGGNGGIGVTLAAGGSVTNTNAIYGGQGGTGGYGGHYGGHGGYGGDGMVFAGPGILINTGIVQGGVGGVGGNGAHGSGASFGGGDGVRMLKGPGTVMNLGRISAGTNGTGDTSSEPQGVELYGGVIVNGSASDHLAQIGGQIGVLANLYYATVENFGDIYGINQPSVYFGDGGRLIAEPGSSFGGPAASGGTLLELAGGAGTLTGLGSTLTVTGSITGSFTGFGSYLFDKGGVWVLDGTNDLGAHRTVISGADLSLTSSGAVSLGDGTTFSEQGLLDTSGAIELTSVASVTRILLGGGATLYSSGTITLGGPKSEISGAASAAKLENAGVISGQGWIGLAAMTLVNIPGGQINATGAQALVVDTKGAVLVNAGVLDAFSGATLVLQDTTVANGAGAIFATSGGRVDLEDDRIEGGAVGVSGPGGPVVVNVAGGELDGHTSGSLTLSGLVAVVNGANEILDGAIANTGQLSLFGAANFADLIIGPDGATLSGKGQLNLSNVATNRIYGQAAADTLTNVDNRIAGAGLLGDGKMKLVNEVGGAIVGNQTTALTINTGTVAIQNAGIIENVGKGGTTIASPLANTGTLFAVTAGTLTLGGGVTGTGTAKINGATLYAKSSFSEDVTFTGTTGILELAHSQTYTGKVTGFSKTGGTTLDLLDIAFKSGTTKATYSGTTASGVLTVTDGAHTAKISLLGNYLSSTFKVSGDNHGGTDVVDPPAGAPSPLASTHRLTQAAAAFAAPPPHLALTAETWRPPPLLARPRAELG